MLGSCLPVLQYFDLFLYLLFAIFYPCSSFSDCSKPLSISFTHFFRPLCISINATLSFSIQGTRMNIFLYTFQHFFSFMQFPSKQRESSVSWVWVRILLEADVQAVNIRIPISVDAQRNGFKGSHLSKVTSWG